MSGVTPCAQVRTMPASRRGCYRRCCRYGSGPGRVTLDQKLWHSSPGRAAGTERPRARHCSHCLFRISISPRPGRPMSWRRGGAGLRAAARTSDCWAAPRRFLGLRRLAAGAGAEPRERPPLLRARRAPEARPRRRLALQSRGPLATSFFHSQKTKEEKKEEGEEKQGEKIAAGTGTVTGTAHRGAPLVERGRGEERGRGKKEIGRLRGPAPRRGLLLSA
ncbi:uncharacterized protein LOC118914214 [Manis pentadactyla]|uniref:uncharacterized protein LOC118914214 n=1 Tax=Manis pentadactyla TaxID=143292 RepID=UPI00255C74FF|nr:uncharacterized protein LOC118914214 [Manis pentadactyla]